MKLKTALTLTALLAFGVTANAQRQFVRALEYLPAPGQFVNTLPEATASTTQEELLNSCTESLNEGGLIHLGSYGGYLTVEFDHPVQNLKGSDLRIMGNGFYANADPVYGDETIGGSFEPGIVYVGVGDDVKTAQWYELAGWEYYYGEIHDFSITYYKPTAQSGPAQIPYSSYDDYIRWECSWTNAQGERCDSTGYHMKNVFHTQSYWPDWIEDEKLTFSGGKLPNNAIDYGQENGNQYWVLYRYAPNAYGYVDDSLNSDDYSTFDIDWAVDSEGNPVHLDEINFIKVVCGIFQYCGWLGETSTEISEFIDLHKEPGYDDNPIIIPQRERPTGSWVDSMILDREDDGRWYNLQGIPVANPQHGIYIHNGKKVMVK